MVATGRGWWSALVPARLATLITGIKWTILFQRENLFQTILIPNWWIAVGYTFRTQSWKIFQHLTNPRKSLGVQEICSNFRYEKCTQAVCRTVPDCTQSWTKYFWTEFGYTFCNQWIPMYHNIRHRIHIFCCASQEDRALTSSPSPITELTRHSTMAATSSFLAISALS